MSPKEARKQYPNDFADDAVYEIVAQVKNQRNTVMKYQNMTGVLKAIRTENIDLNTISTYDCKDELFIKDENADILFSAYYRSHNACTDVCTLLGLSKPIIRPQDVLKIGKNRTAGKPLINHQQIKTAVLHLAQWFDPATDSAANCAPLDQPRPNVGACPMDAMYDGSRLYVVNGGDAERLSALQLYEVVG